MSIDDDKSRQDASIRVVKSDQPHHQYIDDDASTSQRRVKFPSALLKALAKLLVPAKLRRSLTKDDSASTFLRLMNSAHVADLQLIFVVTCFLIVVGPIFVTIWHKWVDTVSVIGSATLISGILGVGCGVMAWIYQTGSARLGIVDLFACEITTICRVITIAETAPHYVTLYRDPPSLPLSFSSQEQYSPVFENNSKDLEVLEARVVGRITEFYTYLKALRDYLRLLSAIEKPSGEPDRWRAQLKSVIYMLFLMLESARNSVDRLIEYWPERAQNTIIILLSEMALYSLLCEIFEAEAKEHPGYSARRERLRLRKNDYLELAPALYWTAKSKKNDRDWMQAAALTEELNFRYHDAFGEWIDLEGSRLAS
jgi:uncharacterized protein (DUF486 family)